MPTLQEAEAAGNTSDVDVDQQLLGELGGGNSLPDVFHPDIYLPDAPLSDAPLPDAPLPEAHPDYSVGKECNSPRIAEEAIIVV